MMKTRPNYHKIYEDILKSKGLNLNRPMPEFDKNIEVIKFNNSISDNKNDENFKENQLSKAYDEKSILEILQYQKKHQISNSELAKIYNLSRNTVARWKRFY